jgi:hypothetical protein
MIDPFYDDDLVPGRSTFDARSQPSTAPEGEQLSVPAARTSACFSP